MSAMWIQVVGMAAAFLFVFTTGFWLTHSGRPYGVALLTLHKIATVGILVLFGTSVYEAIKLSVLSIGVWLVISLALVMCVAMIVSGSVLSIVESPPPAVSLLHRVAPYPTLLLTVAALYCLLSKIGQ